ncbi:hypothetical protein [Bradyrhizobium sp. WD16]|uniref:hypothetical protein n=1 Tax=Bradyrhizobium sp. WD16 TaxID=1521768 RepID=UPI0020A4C38B|nr:hypothetical protein [Bradyrhizobium sp. WD16]UTD28914.1 hypothetical protein DB459_20495 [Bradyrhizobium sp. WD16]
MKRALTILTAIALVTASAAPAFSQEPSPPKGDPKSGKHKDTDNSKKKTDGAPKSGTTDTKTK